MFFNSPHPPAERPDPFKDFPIRPSDYGDAGIEGSLVKLYDVAIAHADRRIKWYDDKADAARWASRRLRSASLIFFALGTIAPIASNIFAGITSEIIELVVGVPELTGPMGRVSVSDVGYIFLALAGGLVVFDQFFEYSASWTRYRQSQARLECLRADLRYTWASHMAAAMHPRRTVICDSTTLKPAAGEVVTPGVKPTDTAMGTVATGVADMGVADTTSADAKSASTVESGSRRDDGGAAGVAGAGGAAADAYRLDDCAVVQMIETLRNFVNSIERLAETETVEWAERFRARIQAFDDQALRGGPGGANGKGPASRQTDATAALPAPEGGVPTRRPGPTSPG